MTFREKLHNDLDGISPSDELLSRVSQMMAEAYPDAEISLVYGGQPVYHYILSVEV